MVSLLHCLHSEATRALVQQRRLLAGNWHHKHLSRSTSRPVVQRDIVAFAKSSKRAKYSQASSRPSQGQPLFIQVEPDGSDVWRLDVVVDALKSGSVSAMAGLSSAAIGSIQCSKSLHHYHLTMFHSCQRWLLSGGNSPN